MRVKNQSRKNNKTYKKSENKRSPRIKLRRSLRVVTSTSGETSRFFKILTDDNNVNSAVHMIAYINIDIPAQCFDFEVSVTTRKIKKNIDYSWLPGVVCWVNAAKGILFLAASYLHVSPAGLWKQILNFELSFRTVENLNFIP